MARVDCPYCGTLGKVSAERIIKARDAATTYFCDECNSEWDERDGGGGPIGPVRTRPSKTHKDKTS